MSVLDVKYVVIVEYINEIGLTDSVAFYTTAAAYAAGLAHSFETSNEISVVGREAGSFTQRPVTHVSYAGV
jgi:hypothetical protein